MTMLADESYYSPTNNIQVQCEQNISAPSYSSNSNSVSDTHEIYKTISQPN